jgi:hypothetical protein
MKIALNILFIAISIVLIYFLADSIRRPVDFRETYAKRSDAVKAKLTEIAELQKMYKTLKGDTTFAGDFDSLQYAFLNDSFFILKIEGDPFDTTIVADTTEVMYPARDSMINYLAKKGFVDASALDKLRQPAMEVMKNWSDTATSVDSDPAVSAYLEFCDKEMKAFFKDITTIPYSDGKTFTIANGVVEMEGRRAFGRTVPTFEVSAQVGDYMKEYPVSEYAMYNPNFSHGNILKVGDLYKSTTSGNW